MNVVDIPGNKRESFGKKGTAELRSAGHIPAELYGGEGNNHFTVEINDIKQLIYTPDFQLANIHLEGKQHKAILKTIQFHPVTDEVLHIDFQELVEDRKLKVEVPVIFEGVSPGVKAGGKLIQLMRKVKIKAFPKDLIDNVKLDISETNLGQSVRIRDIQVPDTIEIMNSPSIPVASVEIPRALKSAKASEEEATEAED